jgi:hypothetical protein
MPQVPSKSLIVRSATPDDAEAIASFEFEMYTRIGYRHRRESIILLIPPVFTCLYRRPTAKPGSGMRQQLLGYLCVLR